VNQKTLARKKKKSIAIEPFIGRGSATNRAITQTLGTKSPQTTRRIGKNITDTTQFKDTSCSTINKRVRDLEKHGYLNKNQVKERVGGITNYYELTPKAFLAKFLDAHTVEDLFEHISDAAALIILADLINATEPHTESEKL
jgi:DNA-binding PadR family transcriptional regulator